MKRKLCVVAVACYLFCLCIAMAENGNEGQNGEEKAEYEYLEDRVEDLQIDYAVIHSVSTENLVELVVNYPLLADAFLFDRADQMMDYFSKSANIFGELENRADSVQCMLNAYENLKVDYENLAVGKSDFIESKYLQEYFFQRYFAAITRKLDEKQKIQLAQILHDKSQQKIGLCDDFLTSEQYYRDMSELGGDFLTDTEYSLSSTTSYTSGFTYLGNTVTRSGVQYYGGLYGKYGVTSYCLKYKSGDYTTAEKNNLDHAVLLAHPSWSLAISATAKFNCHSYAWIQMSASNVYWLDSPSTYAASSSFSHIGSNCGTVSNDRVIITDSYGTIQHSAVVYTNSQMTYSKCGSAGVFYASLSDLVYVYGSEYEVYR